MKIAFVVAVVINVSYCLALPIEDAKARVKKNPTLLKHGILEPIGIPVAPAYNGPIAHLSTGGYGHHIGGEGYGHGYGEPSYGTATGIFPHARTGGCNIPLLLSCAPNVISGYLSHSYSSPAHGYSSPAHSYSSPSYKTTNAKENKDEEVSLFHIPEFKDIVELEKVAQKSAELNTSKNSAFDTVHDPLEKGRSLRKEEFMLQDSPQKAQNHNQKEKSNHQ